MIIRVGGTAGPEARRGRSPSRPESPRWRRREPTSALGHGGAGTRRALLEALIRSEFHALLGVPLEDAQAVHFLAYEGDYAIGTARLLPDGQIGRVSVLKDWRGLNVGDALLAAVIAEAERRGLHEQRLSAQVQATPFYERHGFRILSEEYLDAGIPHVDMLRQQSS